LSSKGSKESLPRSASFDFTPEARYRTSYKPWNNGKLGITKEFISV
jgi:hypothetical protein